MKRRAVLLSSWSVACLTTSWARAQQLPAVVRIIVPFASGGPIGAGARALAQALTQVSGRNFIIDNKAGAGGVIGSAEVARAAPDGGTLLLTTGGHTTGAALYAKLPYDPLKDFTPITMVTKFSGFAVLVPANSRFKTAAELIHAARTAPGTITYGSAGVGNTTHLVGALLARALKLDLSHVPYKGTAPMMNDLLSGQIAMTFLATSLAKPLIEAGKVRAVAVSGDARAPDMPNVPSFGELGAKGVDVPAWVGLFGPAGMSLTTVALIHLYATEAAKQSAIVEANKAQSATAVINRPDEFAAYVAAEVARYKKQLPALGIRME